MVVGGPYRDILELDDPLGLPVPKGEYAPFTKLLPERSSR